MWSTMRQPRASGQGRACMGADRTDTFGRELLLHGARCWRTRRSDPVSFVLFAFTVATLAWVLVFDPRSSKSGYVLYFGLSAWIPLLAVRAAFWLATSAAGRGVGQELSMSALGPGPWVSGFLLPVQGAAMLAAAPAVAWVVFHYPQYLSGYRGLVFVALWAGFIVSAVLDPLLAFGLVSRSARPRWTAVKVALGLVFLKPFPLLWFLDECFRLGRGNGKALIVAGFMIVAAHAWLLRRVLLRIEGLGREWGEGLGEPGGGGGPICR